MARPGRKPTPSAIKVVRGNPGKRPINPGEPRPEVKLPNPPSWLPAEAKREWWRTGRKLLRLRVMTELDKAPLVRYCIAWAVLAKACKDLGIEANKDEMTYVTPKGFEAATPAVGIMWKAIEQLERAESSLGLNPSERTRVRAQPADAAVDPFDAWEKRTGVSP